MNWEAELLRISAFTLIPSTVGADRWLELVIGDLPEMVVGLPRLKRKQAEKDLQSGHMTLLTEPSRVDLLLRAKENVNDETMASLGSVDEAVGHFSSLADRLLNSEELVGVRRVAFGAMLLQRVDDKVSGYKLLSKYLPTISIDPENSSDLSFQINRPRSVAVRGISLRVNRLAKWSVAKRQETRLDTSVQPRRLIAVSELHACRLELDINTDAEHSEALGRETLPGLFRELVIFGLEIAAKGDVR